MEWWEFLLAFFCALAALMVIGVPVAISFIVVNLVGVYFLWGSGGFNQIILSIEHRHRLSRPQPTPKKKMHCSLKDQRSPNPPLPLCYL